MFIYLSSLLLWSLLGAVVGGLIDGPLWAALGAWLVWDLSIPVVIGFFLLAVGARLLPVGLHLCLFALQPLID